MAARNLDDVPGNLVPLVHRRKPQAPPPWVIWEALSEEGAATPRILRVGLPDHYVTHGAPALLHEEVGYTPERIAERVEAAVLDPRGSLA